MSTQLSISSILICLLVATGIIFAASEGSIMINGYSLFALCGVIGFLLHWIIFIPSYVYQTEHYFDLTGSISYIAVLVFAILNKPDIDLRSMLLIVLVGIWAFRLGTFLFLRVKEKGKDSRFNVMKTKFWWFLATWTIGGLWVFITSCAALAALASTKLVALGPFGYLGFLLWFIGFSIEVIADSQKTTFNRKRENEHKFINEGLWQLSRHPNYFGEILLWIGIAMIAFPVLEGWQLVTLISPIFVYVLLIKISGVPMLENKALKRWGEDPEYKKYLESTPKLFLKIK